MVYAIILEMDIASALLEPQETNAKPLLLLLPLPRRFLTTFTTITSRRLDLPS